MRQLSLILLVAYWATLFLLTHVPRLPSGAAHIPDKLAHVGAYLVLAVLLAWFVALRRQLTPRLLLLLWLVLAVYGGLDEITQGFVGRNPDWWDWVADIVGAALGLALFAAAWGLWHWAAARRALRRGRAETAD